MSLHSKKWAIEKNINKNIDLEIHPVVKQILINRGYDEESIPTFLNPSIEQLYDPFEMKGMKKAIDRIRDAMDNGESIWVYGDYDVDGITSISVLMICFDLLGIPANYYIPNRLEEGYGLSVFGMETILAKGADLIISVDCGITSVDEVAYVNKMKKDIIITDHHNCQEELPDAYAILNPKQSDCAYPFDMLAGVGIAMKIVQGLLRDRFLTHYDLFMDVVMLGTVADIAPIVDENRSITKLGLDLIKNSKNIGLQALIEVSDLKDKDINTGHIGFNLGPKINAAGRIGKPDLGVKLLISKDLTEALHIAKALDELNTERQDIEKQIIETIDELIDAQVNLEKEKIIVVKGMDWHTGVIGIVASRITEKYSRPAVILSIEDGIAKGSARSVGNISIFDALNSCKHLFIGFGGHKQAAGLSLNEADVEELRYQINEYAKIHITEEDLVPKVKIDGIIHSNEITHETLDELELLEPHGMGNPKPSFVYNGLTIDNVRLLGQEKSHLKLVLHDGKRTFDAIGFRMADDFSDLRSQDQLDMVMTLNKNVFRGIETIQFMIKDIRRLEPDFYRSTEIGKCFTKTLARALFYNGLDGPKRPSYAFTDFNKENINRLDYATETGGKRIVLVQSFYSFIELYFRLDDLNISSETIKIHFNDISEKSDIDIVVNPIFKNIDFEHYDEVVVYDLLFSENWAGLLDNYSHSKVKYLTDPYFDEKVQTELLYTAIPHRLDLVDIYKSLLAEEGKLTIELEDFSKVLHMDIIKCELSLRILEHLQLIKIVEAGVYHIEVMPRPKEKLNLENTDIFQKVSCIRDEFFDYIKIYKEIIK